MDFKINENTDIFKYVNNFDKYKHIGSKLIVGNINTKIPFISIVLPTYKRTELLKESINSALYQVNYNNYEIIVVDNEAVFDVETETEKLLKSYKNDKLFYYKNEQNIGMYGNWNRGIELARGKFITLLHDDDTLCEDFLYSIFKVIKHYNFKGIIGTDFNIIHEIKQNNTLKSSVDNKFKVRNLKFRNFYLGDDINIVAMTFYKKHAINIGGFSEQGDFAFRINYVKNYKAINVNKKLANYRIFRNESLNKETIINTIILVYYVRKNLVKFNLFYRIFDFIFSKEYIFEYIQGAAKYWNMELDSNYIFGKIGIENYKLNYLKYYSMKVVLKFLGFLSI